jgi:hypothetical protein
VAESIPALGETAEEGSRGIKAAARYDGPKTPFERVVASKQGGCSATHHSERTAKISRSVSVSKNHRQETRTDLPPGEPAAESESAGAARVQPDTKWPAKRLWKRRSLRELGNPFGIPTFPQPQQQQAFSGYISNGSTGIARVTFLDGLTRSRGEVFLLELPRLSQESALIGEASGLSGRNTHDCARIIGSVMPSEDRCAWRGEPGGNRPGARQAKAR